MVQSAAIPLASLWAVSSSPTPSDQDTSTSRHQRQQRQPISDYARSGVLVVTAVSPFTPSKGRMPFSNAGWRIPRFEDIIHRSCMYMEKHHYTTQIPGPGMRMPVQGQPSSSQVRVLVHGGTPQGGEGKTHT